MAFLNVKNNSMYQMVIVVFYNYNLIILIPKLCVQSFLVEVNDRIITIDIINIICYQ